MYASFLIPIGLGVGYLAFIFRDCISKVNVKRIVWIAIVTVVSLGALYRITYTIPKKTEGNNFPVRVVVAKSWVRITSSESILKAKKVLGN